MGLVSVCHFPENGISSLSVHPSVRLSVCRSAAVSSTRPSSLSLVFCRPVSASSLTAASQPRLLPPRLSLVSCRRVGCPRRQVVPLPVFVPELADIIEVSHYADV